MVEQVVKRTLFHVTIPKPYKSVFTAGQKVTLGTTYTPFFNFYEGSRQYPVNQADGSVIQVKAIKFLTAVRDGQISCPNLPTIAREIASHYVMLARELIMEEIRLSEFPSD